MKSALAIALVLLCGCERPDIPIADTTRTLEHRPAIAEKPYDTRDPDHWINNFGTWMPFPVVPCPCGCKQSPCLCPECYCDDALLEVTIRPSPAVAEKSFQGRKGFIGVRVLNEVGEPIVGARVKLLESTVSVPSQYSDERGLVWIPVSGVQFTDDFCIKIQGPNCVTVYLEYGSDFHDGMFLVEVMERSHP